MKDNKIAQLKRERGVTTEFVYDLLKGMILEWKIQPGQKININQMSREINISTIPLREALSRLHSDNLVVLEPNKGYRVSGVLDNKKISDLVEARLLIETHAIRTIIQFNRLHIVGELIKLTEQMASIEFVDSSYKELLEFNKLDSLFHDIIIDAGENHFLSEAYKGMHYHLNFARFYHLRGQIDQQEGIAEHGEIIDAIRTRDVYRAESAVMNHVRSSKKRLEPHPNEYNSATVGIVYK